jgi:hypothetical protein
MDDAANGFAADHHIETALNVLQGKTMGDE